MVGGHMMRIGVYCHPPHCVYHRDGVWCGLAVLLALCILEVSRERPLSAGFAHAAVSLDAYREESDDYLLPNHHIPCAAVLLRLPSHLGTNHRPPVDL